MDAISLNFVFAGLLPARASRYGLLTGVIPADPDFEAGCSEGSGFFHEALSSQGNLRWQKV